MMFQLIEGAITTDVLSSEEAKDKIGENQPYLFLIYLESPPQAGDLALAR